MENKKELRAVCRAKRKEIKDKPKKSAGIVSQILDMPQVKNADALFLFYPLEGEVDLLPLVDFALQNGKKIGFPLCESREGDMSFRLVASLAELEVKSFGIKEPKVTAPEILPQNAVIFLPALAIDREGYRLGYGKGYYDRYLSRYADLKPFTVGVVYRELLLDSLPHDSHDIPCDSVIFA